MKTDTRGGHATTEADPWFLQAKGHPGSAATPRNKEETRKASTQNLGESMVLLRTLNFRRPDSRTAREYLLAKSSSLW